MLWGHLSLCQKDTAKGKCPLLGDLGALRCVFMTHDMTWFWSQPISAQYLDGSRPMRVHRSGLYVILWSLECWTLFLIQTKSPTGWPLLFHLQSPSSSESRAPVHHRLTPSCQWKIFHEVIWKFMKANCWKIFRNLEELFFTWISNVFSSIPM